MYCGPISRGSAVFRCAEVVNVKCPVCDREMSDRRRHGEPRRFCSRECAIKSQSRPNEYVDLGDYTGIVMANAKRESHRLALIDHRDAEAARRVHWYVSMAARTYPVVRADTCGQHLELSRFLMNPAPGLVVDHINGNPMDNRRANLRVCTQEENMRNIHWSPETVSRRIANGSDDMPRGVYFRGDGKRNYRYRAEVYLGGNVWRRDFATADEAAAWRSAKRQELGLV